MKFRNSTLIPAFLGVALTCAAPIWAASQDDAAIQDSRQVRMVSPELFAALENWSDPAEGVESVALDSYPSAIKEYALSLKEVYRGRALSDHFAEAYPSVNNLYSESTGQERPEGDDEFLAFVMENSDHYQTWQSEETLVRAGQTFKQFVERNYPRILDEVAAADSRTPAKAGITMADYVRGLGDERLDEELHTVLDTVGGNPLTSCDCWTIVTTPSQPYETEVEADEHPRDSWGWPKKETELDYTVESMGVAKDMGFRRYSKRTVWLQQREKEANHAQLRVRMHCTANGVPGGAQCEGSTCTGEMAVRVEYGSRVYEDVAAGGIWSKRARALAADVATLRFSTGPAEMILFEKGVAVTGDYQTGWDAAALLQTISAVGQLAIAIAGDNTNWGDLLEGDLLNQAVEGFTGIITREGDAGAHSQDMYVAFDTVGTAPFALSPNTTLLLTLDTAAAFWGRGYGKWSESWGFIDSSFFIGAVTRNYQCAAGVGAPTPRGHWLWATSGTPHSSNTLKGLVTDFVATELGAFPTCVDQQRGQYP